MANKRKSRPFRSDSLSEASEAEVIDVTGAEAEEITSNTDAPPLTEDPILSAGRIEREYTESTVSPDLQTPAQSGTDGGYGYQDSPAPDNIFSNSTSGTPPATVQPDTGSGESTLEMPDEATKQGSHDLADFILDAYDRFVPELGHSFSKINEKEIKKLEESGDMLPGAYDDVKEHNKGNKTLLEEKTKADVKYLRKHLRNVLQIRQVSASPETLLIIAVIIVVIGQFILISSIRKENNDMYEKLISKINSGRRSQDGPVQDNKVHTPTVEEVTV